MASFADKIPQFKPYVSQLPVELMTQVGVYKQAQYDAGVQKVQSYVDNVTGINVSRPIDKQHLQSKFSQLNNQLKYVASGDFSNQQLVNSVGGMATSIIKDPIIQAAMYSTANDNNNLSEMEADRKAGILTPQAEYVYGLKRNAYLNNPNLKDERGNPITFSGKYTKSWNIEKAMSEELKGIGDGSYTVENLFVTETDPVTGQTVIKRNIEKVRNPKTGAIEEVDKGPMYSEYAVKEIHTGRLPEAVRAAIDGVLNRPEAKVELGMRGVYEYRGYENINDFIDKYEKEKQEGARLLLENRLDVQGKLLDEKDPIKRQQLESLILNIDKQITNLTTSVGDKEAIAQGYANNLDGYKAMLYTQQTRNNFMREYNNATISRQYIENVGLKQHEATIKAERDYWKDQQDVALGWYNAKTNRLEYQLKKDKQDLETIPEIPTEGPAPVKMLYPQKISEANEIEEAYNGTKNELVKQYTALLNPNLTDAQVVATINKFEKQSPGFTDRMYDKAKTAILENKNNVKYSKISSLFKAAKDNEKKLAAVSNELRDLDMGARAELGDKYFDFKQLEKGLSPVEVTYTSAPEGAFAYATSGLFGGATTSTKITLKPNDLINVAIIQNDRITSSKAESELAKKAKKALELSTGRPYNEVVNAVQQTFAQEAMKRESPFAKQYINVSKQVGSKMFAETLEAKERILEKMGIENSSVNFGLYPKGADEKTIGTINRDFTTLLNTYKVAGYDVTKYENYLAPTAENKGKYSVNIGVNRDNPVPQFTFDLYDGGELVQSLPVVYKGVNGVANRKLKIPMGVSDAARTFTWNSKKENPTYSTNSMTANPFNDNAYKGAYYTNADLEIPEAPYFLGADTYQNYSGGFNAYIYVKQGKGVVAYPIKQGVGKAPIDFPSVDGADVTIRSLGSKAAIDNIIKNNK